MDLISSEGVEFRYFQLIGLEVEGKESSRIPPRISVGDLGRW